MEYRVIVHICKGWDYASDPFKTKEDAIQWTNTHWHNGIQFTIVEEKPSHKG